MNAALALGMALAPLGAAGSAVAGARPLDAVPEVRDADVVAPDLDGASGAPSQTGTLRLRAGRHERWIDRVELPGYARGLYDLLVEATDADGADDVLIDGAGPADDGSPATVARWREAGRVVDTSNGAYLTLGSAGHASLAEASEAASVAFAAFDRDHPEVFWLTGACRVGGFVDEGGELLVGFKLSDPGTGFDLRQAAFREGGALRAAIAERDALAREILADGPSLASGARDYEVVRWIHGQLAARNEYNRSVAEGRACDDPLVWECLSALRGRSGDAGPTCEGYARAFKVLCDRAGVACALSRGLARHAPGAHAERHMWDLVRVSGAWYAADVTWDDAGDVPSRGHLLAGAETVVGLEGAFGSSHVATDETFRGMARLANEPELSRERFVPGDAVAVLRLWNASSGAHLLTTDPREYHELERGGEWKGEGVRFYGRATDGVPVWRLWNPSNGDHHYTAVDAERAALADAGWVEEGIAFRGAEDVGADPVYRLWNCRQVADGGLGSHLWTEDAGEYRSLPLCEPVGAWRRESVAWRAVWFP